MSAAKPFLHFAWAEKHDPEWSKWRRTVPLPETLTAEQRHKFLSMLSFSKYNQVISISPSLCEALARTTLNGITFQEIPWPYNAVYVAFPGGMLPSELALRAPGKAPLVGVYLARPFMSGLFDGGPNPPHISFHGVSRPSSKSRSYECLSGSVPEKDQRDDVEELLEDRSMSFLRVCLNALLYLSTTSACKEIEVVEGFTRKRKRRRSRKALPTTTITHIGQPAARPPQPQLGSVVDDRRPVREHWVKGHWHKYWVGKGRTELRVNLVMPFRRGHGPGIEGRIYKDKEGW